MAFLRRHLRLALPPKFLQGFRFQPKGAAGIRDFTA